MTMRSSSFFRAIKVTLLITVCTISTVIPAFSQKVPVKNIVLVHGAWADRLWVERSVRHPSERPFQREHCPRT